MIHPTEFAPQIKSVWMMAERSQNWQTSETVLALLADNNGCKEGWMPPKTGPNETNLKLITAVYPEDLLQQQALGRPQ